MSMSENRRWGGGAVRPASQSLMTRHAKPAHKKAAKVLGYALTLDTPDDWFATSALWQARLMPQETAAIGWAALHATGAELAEMVARGALEGVGAPLPTFSDFISEASWWADLASDRERKEFLLACFTRLCPADQIAFIASASRSAAA